MAASDKMSSAQAEVIAACQKVVKAVEASGSKAKSPAKPKAKKAASAAAAPAAAPAAAKPKKAKKAKAKAAPKAKAKAAPKAASAAKKGGRRPAETIKLTAASLKANEDKLAAFNYYKVEGGAKDALQKYYASVEKKAKKTAEAAQATTPAKKKKAKAEASAAGKEAEKAKATLKKKGVKVPSETTVVAQAAAEGKISPKAAKAAKAAGSGKKAGGKKKKAAKRASNPMHRGHGGLYRAHNPTFTAMQTAAAVITTGVTFTLIDLLDRFIATRQVGPLDPNVKGPEGVDGVGPFYGQAAATRTALKPGALRLGVQAGVSVAGFLGAYYVKNDTAKAILGGIGTGAGVHWVFQLLNSYVMPMVFKAESPVSKDLGNRLYPLEQEAVQEAAAKRVEAENKAIQTTGSPGGAAKASYVGLAGVSQRPAAPPRVWPTRVAAPALPARVPPMITRPMSFAEPVAGVGSSSFGIAAARQQAAGVGGCGCQKNGWGGGGCGPDCGCPACRALYGAMNVGAAKMAPVQQRAMAMAPGGKMSKRRQAAMAAMAVMAAEPAAPALPAASNDPRWFDAEKNVWFTADGRETRAPRALPSRGEPAATAAQRVVAAVAAQPVAAEPAAATARPAASNAARWFDAQKQVWFTEDGRELPGVSAARQRQVESQLAEDNSLDAKFRPAAELPNEIRSNSSAKWQEITNVVQERTDGPETPLDQEAIVRVVRDQGLNEAAMMATYLAQQSRVAEQIAGVGGVDDSPPKGRRVLDLDAMN